MSSTQPGHRFQRPLSELKNAHSGEDIWVIASGASMDFVDADFFANKITVGVNRVNRKFDCSYIVAKDASGFDELLQFRKNARFVFSRYESGDLGNPLNDVEYEHWVFDHPRKLANQAPDLSVIGSDQLVVSYSTITSALHLAAYLGAHSIVVCGHDCGAINGEISFRDYYSNLNQIQGSDPAYYRWLGEIEQHSVGVIREVRRVYRVSVHSLNPFLNFNLDGHTFESSSGMEHRGEMSRRLLELEREERRIEVESLRRQVREVTAVQDQLYASWALRLQRAVLRPVRWLRGHTASKTRRKNSE